MRRRLRRWRDLPLMGKGLLLLSLPMLLLLGSLLFGLQLGRQVAEAESEARRTLQVQSELQVLHKLIAEAAMGVRGYLLTGRDDFLLTYWQADVEIPTALSRLDAGIKDPAQRASLEKLRPLLTAKLASLNQLRTSGRMQSAKELQDHLLESKAILDSLRGQLESLQRRESELIEERTGDVAKALRRSLWINLVTIGVALMIAIATVAVFYTSIAARVGRIAANAERLLHGRPLLPLAAATDELGLLTSKLQEASALLAVRATESQSANRAKTEFLSRVSHELRTPLNAILGFAQLLESETSATTHRPALAQIIGAGRHLLNLIDELIDISRIESGQLPLTIEPVPLNALLEEAISLSGAIAQKRNVQLILEQSSPDLAVMADRQRLMQVLLNLISNGIKFNREGGRLWLSRTQMNEYVEITVSDEGLGIPSDLHSRLFQPFERLDAESRGAEGTGLGLAIARQLTRAMGGDVAIENRAGGGCQFTIRLRAAPVSQVESRSKFAAPADPDHDLHRNTPASRTTRSVVAIEDNASNRALIEALMFRRSAWQLHLAKTAAEGRRLIMNLRPDLVLLDLHLPDQPGEALLAEIRGVQQLAATRVAILSADALPETRQRLLEAGAAAFMSKPIDVKDFYALLDSTP
jgi:signal transduction histidine kinase/ActR/RegA family two-component response regulator